MNFIDLNLVGLLSMAAMLLLIYLLVRIWSKGDVTSMGALKIMAIPAVFVVIMTLLMGNLLIVWLSIGLLVIVVSLLWRKKAKKTTYR